VPFVTVIRKREHDNGSKNVGRRDQALRRGDVETHALVQNDGQEVCDGVGARSGQAEEASEAPDFQVSRVREVGSDVESVTCQRT
jgi:hypothetical protein